MSMFEKATRQKLRFQTSVGFIGVEDLWDLPLTKLNSLAKNLNRELKTAEEEDFLQEKSSEDVETKLKFDIVLHILSTKKDEKKARETSIARKAEREKILGILAKKQDDALENMSEDDLRKKLEELS
jgi:hypothetical protein